MDDMNYRKTDWYCAVADLESEDFLNVVQESILKQVIRERIRRQNSDNIVNVIQVEGQLGSSAQNEI